MQLTRLALRISFLAVLGLHASTSRAEVILVSETSEIFEPQSMETLTQFQLITMKKWIRLPSEPIANQTFATDIRAVLKTNSLSHLPDFLVVQFIRGCQFESQWNGHSLTKTLNISRYHMGKIVPFVHRTWEFDSDIADPAYSADERFGRYALWRWNDDSESFDAETSHYLASRPTPHPIVFLTDLPGGAFVYPGSTTEHLFAKNSSLEFQTCLFRTSDVPPSSDASGANIPKEKAIHCFYWDHKYVYNPKTKTFIEGGTIDPVCR